MITDKHRASTSSSYEVISFIQLTIAILAQFILSVNRNFAKYFYPFQRVSIGFHIYKTYLFHDQATPLTVNSTY